ncbi:MAG: four helix bundle protein [Bacteroidetes bacterium]|nr:four helix bundle protein [Bacteroidota bacterium]
MESSDAKMHESLDCWRLAMDLVVLVYKLTAFFPQHEQYALTQQLHRAVQSIPSNIAEGRAKRTANETLHALFIARGSLAEVETQLQIAARLEYIQIEEDHRALLNRVSQSLNGFIRFMKKKSRST